MYNPPIPGPGVWEWETCIFQEIKERKNLWYQQNVVFYDDWVIIRSMQVANILILLHSVAVILLLNLSQFVTLARALFPFFSASIFLPFTWNIWKDFTYLKTNTTDFDRCLLIHLIWFLLARHQVTHDNSKFMIKINPRCTYSPNNNYRYKSCIDWFLSNSSARCRLKQRNYKNM